MRRGPAGVPGTRPRRLDPRARSVSRTWSPIASAIGAHSTAFSSCHIFPCARPPRSGARRSRTKTLEPSRSPTRDDEWMERSPRARVLFGNSFGCQTLDNLAVRHTRGVERLVLQDPDDGTRMRTHRSWPDLGLVTGTVLRAPIGRVADPPQGLTDAGVKRAVETIRLMRRDHIEEQLPLIEQPTLVIRGKRETERQDPLPGSGSTGGTRLLPEGSSSDPGLRATP